MLVKNKMLQLQNILCEIHAKHTLKAYSRYIKYKEEEILAYHCRNIIKSHTQKHTHTKQERKKELKKLGNSEKTVNEMTVINLHLSTITLIINGLIKR